MEGYEGGNAVIHHVLHRKSSIIRKALESGELSNERWLSYMKLKTENEYALDGQSYLLNKEKKFKEIAKYNKSNRKR